MGRDPCNGWIESARRRKKIWLWRAKSRRIDGRPIVPMRRRRSDSLDRGLQAAEPGVVDWMRFRRRAIRRFKLCHQMLLG